MALADFKQIIADGGLLCPQCEKPIKKFEKYIETTASVWDGAGDSNLDTDSGVSKVTLICGNDNCSWQERTEYWRNYSQD